MLALCGGEAGWWTYAYNVPEHAAMLQERLEENMVRYRVSFNNDDLPRGGATCWTGPMPGCCNQKNEVRCKTLLKVNEC